MQPIYYVIKFLNVTNILFLYYTGSYSLGLKCPSKLCDEIWLPLDGLFVNYYHEDTNSIK